MPGPSVPPALLEEIAASVAVAVDHCVAFEERGKLRDELAALLEVNRAVARHLRRDELFATLAQCLRDLLPSDRFGIELPVDGNRLKAYVFVPGTPTAAHAHLEDLPAAGTACRWTEETRQWVVASSRDELQERFPVTVEVMRREGMQSLVAMPLLSAGRCLGLLFRWRARCRSRWTIAWPTRRCRACAIGWRERTPTCRRRFAGSTRSKRSWGRVRPSSRHSGRSSRSRRPTAACSFSGRPGPARS